MFITHLQYPFKGIFTYNFNGLSSFSGVSDQCSACHINSRHHVSGGKFCGVISLEVFAATEFNKIFAGRQPRQDVKVFRRFGK